MGEPRNHAPWCSFEHEGSCPAENEMPRLRAELREPDLAAELARVRAELERMTRQYEAAFLAAKQNGEAVDRERAAREKAETERDRWRQAAKSRLDGSVIARAEQAESRLEQLRGEEAVERAAEVLWDQAEREHADYVNGRYQPKPWSTARIQDRKDYLALARSALEAALLGRGGE